MSRRRRRDEQETVREVHRAELMLADARNTSPVAAARMLRDDAAAAGISVHAAALAAVAALAAGSASDGLQVGWGY